MLWAKIIIKNGQHFVHLRRGPRETEREREREREREKKHGSNGNCLCAWWILAGKRETSQTSIVMDSGKLSGDFLTVFDREPLESRSSRQSDHTKTSWPSKRDANCSDMVMSPVHQVWPWPLCKAQWKGEEDKADRGRGGKTTSGNGQAWSSPSPRGQWSTVKNGGNWLRNHLWCPNDPRG